jgi:hypothetical protein
MTTWDNWQYYPGEWIGEGTGQPEEFAPYPEASAHTKILP